MEIRCAKCGNKIPFVLKGGYKCYKCGSSGKFDFMNLKRKSGAFENIRRPFKSEASIQSIEHGLPHDSLYRAHSLKSLYLKLQKTAVADALPDGIVLDAFDFKKTVPEFDAVQNLSVSGFFTNPFLADKFKVFANNEINELDLRYDFSLTPILNYNAIEHLNALEEKKRLRKENADEVKAQRRMALEQQREERLKEESERSARLNLERIKAQKKDGLKEFFKKNKTALFAAASFLFVAIVFVSIILSTQNKTRTPGTGTDNEFTNKNGIYDIYTVDDLLSLPATAKKVTLKNTLSLSGIEWTPLGTIETPFEGEFDGNGHAIYNAKITQSEPFTFEGKKYIAAGFFGVTKNSVIKNLQLANPSITVEKPGTGTYYLHCGGISGMQLGGDIIYNCKLNIRITAPGFGFDSMIGGVSGGNLRGSEPLSAVQLCEVNASITASRTSGITPLADIVSDCELSGPIECTYYEGISESAKKVEHVFSAAVIKASNYAVGFGGTLGSIINNCVNADSYSGTFLGTEAVNSNCHFFDDLHSQYLYSYEGALYNFFVSTLGFSEAYWDLTKTKAEIQLGEFYSAYYPELRVLI